MKRELPPLLTVLGIRWYEIEWHDAPPKRGWRKKLIREAEKVTRAIEKDWKTWRAAERQRLAETAALIARDRHDQKLRDLAEAESKDHADTIRIAGLMAARIAPAIQRAVNAECRALRKQIKKDRQKIEAKGRRIAAEKLLRFKARRRA